VAYVAMALLVTGVVLVIQRGDPPSSEAQFDPWCLPAFWPPQQSPVLGDGGSAGGPCCLGPGDLLPLALGALTLPLIAIGGVCGVDRAPSRGADRHRGAAWVALGCQL
jgi:hypothetical protein